MLITELIIACRCFAEDVEHLEGQVVPVDPRGHKHRTLHIRHGRLALSDTLTELGHFLVLKLLGRGEHDEFLLFAGTCLPLDGRG